MVTHDTVEVVVRLTGRVFSGGAFEEEHASSNMYKSDDPGMDGLYTYGTAEEIVRKELPGQSLATVRRCTFWDWWRGCDVVDRNVFTVQEVLEVKVGSQVYISGK